ncbi:hypothetical protein CR513_18586, partial [Mucuna pruriens]
MKHPTEDHSLFGIDLLDEIVEEYFQLNSNSEDIEKFSRSTNEINYLGSADEEADYEEVQDLPNSEDNHSDIVDLDFEVELSNLINQVCNLENPESTTNAEVKVAETEESPIAQPNAEIMSAHLVPSQNQVGQTDPNPLTEKSPSPPPPMELKPLPSHIKYAYLDKDSNFQLSLTIISTRSRKTSFWKS